MIKNSKFEKILYFEFGGKGAKSGIDADNALPISTALVMAIEAGMVIEKLFMLIDSAITGTTALTVGDDDTAAGYLPDQAANFATPGMYGWDAKTGGSYLRIQTAGATDAGDIYVVPSAKYYSLATKSVKVTATTANTAGKFRLVVQGHKLTK